MFRSMSLFLVNDTKKVKLRRVNFLATSGMWARNGDHGQWVPPEWVDPGAKAHFATESDGAATGCSGFVDYVLELPGSGDIGRVSFSWSNPTIGQNDVYGSVQYNADPKKYELHAWVENNHPEGDHASVNVAVKAFKAREDVGD